MVNKINGINLLVTIDRKYISPLITMLDSFCTNHKDFHTTVYVANSELDNSDFDSMKSELSAYNVEIIDTKITDEAFADIPVLERLPKESFYRLMAFDFLPEKVERCLYLDPDTIILKPLIELYTTDLEDNYIAAASHTSNPLDSVNCKRLGLEKKQKYLNSGVMLMNLKKIKEDFSVKTIFDTAEENVQKLIMGDQDLVNILFGHKAVLVDAKIYNLNERTFKNIEKDFTLEDVKSQTAIIHYTGDHKPWLKNYNGKLDIFYPAVKEKGASPKGKIKSLIKSVRSIVNLSTRQKVAILVGALILALCIFGWIFFGKTLLKIVAEPQIFKQWLNQFGAFDEIIFILIRSVQTVIKFIPAEPLEIASGYAWGAIPGMFYCIIGNMIGTVIILSLVRFLCKDFISDIIKTKNPKILNFLQNSDKMYLLIFILYIIPGTPKDAFTYVVGMLPVKTIPFMIISFVARMPSVITSTICGETLAEENYILAAIIFGATVLISFLGTLVYKKILSLKKTT